MERIVVVGIGKGGRIKTSEDVDYTLDYCLDHDISLFGEKQGDDHFLWRADLKPEPQGYRGMLMRTEKQKKEKRNKITSSK